MKVHIVLVRYLGNHSEEKSVNEIKWNDAERGKLRGKVKLKNRIQLEVLPQDRVCEAVGNHRSCDFAADNTGKKRIWK